MEEILDILIKEAPLHKEIYTNLNIDQEDLSIFDDLFRVASKIRSQLDTSDIDSPYKELYKNKFDEILSNLVFRGASNSNFTNGLNSYDRENYIKRYQNSYKSTLSLSVNSLDFQFRFFENVGYLKSNLVLIGANGAGKTSLSNKLKEFLNNNGVVISAQRILKLPNFAYVNNPQITEQKLREIQIKDHTYKDENSFYGMADDFGIILQHLIAEHTVSAHQYRAQAIDENRNEKKISAPQKTNLDATINIWNSLIQHRYIKCEDGINIKTYTKDRNEEYESIRMSDGEKVLLYLIGQVLQAPKDGFIVVDEPEMYLHKTILNKLWDVLESEREDCKFFYLTHDLDFASSRKTAKKIWIKSYIHPDDWDFEIIPENEIPEPLLLELLGSRKNILFCEGIKGSNDEKIYSLLFPNFTVTPVGSCFDVMNHTKAFNKLNSTNTNALGLIDSDHHSPERLTKLKTDSIFSFSVSEVENLFLDEEFLKIFAESTLCDETKISLIKENIIKELDKTKELQISNYISTKTNNIFTDNDLSKGNNIQEVKDNYQTFLNSIDIDDFYVKRKLEIEQIIASNDYEKAISAFNNKGLKAIASRHFSISDFTERAFKLLQSKPESLEPLKKYFPSELVSSGQIPH
ncbi:AAA family ATPase [Sphingobacterium faecale]|uniref:ATP-binding protein n=1 Tax=Sphingobacterium faecale TaxID=2803775 RepID=A0ABS1R9W6_9SPHI|nr:AAA family ATPase [Sphingobacterium faecale]MBL1411508.1 ATP-binding protein [Sphingobacterium faecale]